MQMLSLEITNDDLQLRLDEDDDHIRGLESALEQYEIDLDARDSEVEQMRSNLKNTSRELETFKVGAATLTCHHHC